MADVAREAGVSISTVSHVLNATRAVSPETRQRVVDAMAATNFRRNVLATALVTSRTHAIGLSISALQNPYFANLVHSIEKRASARGYSLVMGDSHDDEEVEGALLGTLLDRRVDGMIIAPAPHSETANLPRVLNDGTPVVLIDRHADVECDQIAPDNVEPTRLISSHLVELGHSYIAAVTGLPAIQSTEERIQGFEAAIAQGGPGVKSTMVRGNSKAKEAYRAVRRLFSGTSHRPTALVVLNNAMTIGSMQALKDLGLRVPGDVALTCYDDFEWADVFEPQLTAIEQDVKAMGHTAVDLLIDRIDGKAGPRKVLRTKTIYHHRNSCGCTN
ncbi:LacI family DNA-binding transcriptional regulator [Arthrobacter sp. STN4]|uniref:LacI family DNA-binding transcriptional regulator n=1 Tax=Arthrobacter sp. STN4 TaxID=2923276 RepID=UPI00211A9996|nr:LacI family DNA-binding transcriptional regulator [Arthrobacter sp. STN4]MCQ9165218.1 LacI family transcriptional regulator [Arthrobacter sp. STN4]